MIRTAVTTFATCLILGAGPAAAEGWAVSTDYVVDLAGVSGRTDAGRVLDNLLISAEATWDAAPGFSLYGSVLSNSGGQPNELAETLQGINNIEVSRPKAKVYELWIQQEFGPVSVRAGLYDLNSEFYSTDSSGLLINPGFGIGSELASTGPNGPSIFPSTALAARLRWSGDRGAYVQAAILNALAGGPGDPDGVDLSFDDGALAIAEAGWAGHAKVALGAWRYTDRQPSFTAATPEVAQGAYLLIDQPLLGGPEGRSVSGFVRLGVADGESSPFAGGGQIGLLMSQVLAARPDSQLSLGVHTGVLAGPFRRELAAGGLSAARAETGVEITYADAITKHLTLQPSVQWIAAPGGDSDADAVAIFVLRAALSF